MNSPLFTSAITRSHCACACAASFLAISSIEGGERRCLIPRLRLHLADLLEVNHHVALCRRIACSGRARRLQLDRRPRSGHRSHRDWPSEAMTVHGRVTQVACSYLESIFYSSEKKPVMLAAEHVNKALFCVYDAEAEGHLLPRSRRQGGGRCVNSCKSLPASGRCSRS